MSLGITPAVTTATTTLARAAPETVTSAQAPAAEDRSRREIIAERLLLWTVCGTAGGVMLAWLGLLAWGLLWLLGVV